VYLLEPAHTQFDLKFHLFRIPVRVHPMFWVLSAVLGWRGGPRADAGSTFLLSLLVWVAVCFVSILIHEMGHVFMGRLFRGDGHIVLYSFGGLAIGISVPHWWQRVLVSFAGPLAQFVLLGVTFVVIWNYGDAAEKMHPLVGQALGDLFVINLFWPVLNLLPIWPLDGGQISREVFARAMPENGVRVSLGISLVVAAVLAINSLLALPSVRGEPLIPVVGWLFAGGLFMVIFFGLFAIQSWQALQALDAQRRWQYEHWED
jgi:Zn-dependent protease